MNSGKFRGKGQEILIGQRPSSLNEFLDESPSAGNPESRNRGRSERRDGGITEHRNTATSKGRGERTVREEFRCTPQLSERLNTYVFEQKKVKRSISKTDVLNEALEIFLKKKRY